MKTIFDCETEIGTCDPGWEGNESPTNGTAEAWKIFAHTKAALTRVNGMLKIEQRCFLRQGQEVSDHPSVKPDMMLEPALESEEQSLALVEHAHRQFVCRARQQIDDGCLA